jgi:hypothetical protein
MDIADAIHRIQASLMTGNLQHHGLGLTVKIGAGNIKG